MARLPDIESEQSKVTTVLRAMSNAKRMRILNELSDGRERSVSELEGVIASLSQSALSQHLARLRRANIVRTRRESQTIYYSIDDADVLRILWLLSHIYNYDPVMKHTTHDHLRRANNIDFVATESTKIQTVPLLNILRRFAFESVHRKRIVSRLVLTRCA